MTHFRAPAPWYAIRHEWHLFWIPGTPLPRMCLQCGGHGRPALVEREVSYVQRKRGSGLLLRYLMRTRRRMTVPLCAACAASLTSRDRLRRGLLLLSALSFAAFVVLTTIRLMTSGCELDPIISAHPVACLLASFAAALLAVMSPVAQGLRLAEQPVTYGSVQGAPPVEVVKLAGVHVAVLDAISPCRPCDVPDYGRR